MQEKVWNIYDMLLTFQVDSEVVAVVAVVSEVVAVVEEEAEEGLEVGVEGGSDHPSVDNGSFLTEETVESVTEQVEGDSDYSKCSKILNYFLSFSNEMLVFRAGIHKLLVRIANREDPDQTASSEVV